MNEEHWQHIYNTKNDDQVSWTQPYPRIAIDYITSLGLPLTANIIDIGGGTGNFVDALLDLGYTNITVLDISEAALAKSKARLGNRSSMVTWIIADITTFTSDKTYDFWYDRAVFHFLTSPEDISTYVKLVSKNVSRGGHFLLCTFSINGPLRCSGLEVQRYSDQSMKETFQDSFLAQSCCIDTHVTPFGTKQEFQICMFVRG